MRDDGYTLIQVERLLGLHESWGSNGERHVTVLDLLSWARDPGGMSLRADRFPDLREPRARRRHRPDRTLPEGWTATRGPLPPDSELACVLWDFERAMKTLKLGEQAIVAMAAFGFTEAEIADVINELGKGGHYSQQRISRILHGRPRRDQEGKIVQAEDGRPVVVGGLTRKLQRAMNRPEGGKA